MTETTKKKMTLDEENIYKQQERASADDRKEYRKQNEREMERRQREKANKERKKIYREKAGKTSQFVGGGKMNCMIQTHTRKRIE